MSGLEALAALGLACNIFQVISFGHETLVLLKRIYRERVLDSSQNFYAAELQQAAKDIHAQGIPSQPTPQDRRLLETAKKCSEVCQWLLEEIDFQLNQAKKKRQLGCDDQNSYLGQLAEEKTGTSRG